MEGIHDTWRRMPMRSRLLALGLPVILVAGAAGAGVAAVTLTARNNALPGPDASVPPVAVATPSPLPPEPSVDPSAAPEPSPTPAPPGADPLLGTDGRLTVLLLGSDYRPAHPGNRTDAIMVVSVDPSTGEAAGFSIPRDTVNFPLPSGGAYHGKINALYEYLDSRSGKGGAVLSGAISKAFGIEVDGYVFIGFAGVKDLVRAVGGVDVTLDQPYYDAEYWVTASHRGWGLPKGRSHLGPNDALIFARSRKGDNDFGRARRQQLLVLAALDKVRKAGVGKIPSLLRVANNTVRTDLPLDRAADLFAVVATTNIAKVDRVVFGPRTFASGVSGTSFALRLSACRAWIKSHFPAARPMGQWPATVVPSSAPASVAP